MDSDSDILTRHQAPALGAPLSILSTGKMDVRQGVNLKLSGVERLTDKFIGRSDYSPVAYGLLPKPGGTGGNYDPHVKGKNVSAFIVHSVTH